MSKKAVHFGAGNIGRGFIGLLLARAGYEVVFVDVNEQVIHALNEKGQYTVTLAEENGQVEVVKGVRGLNSNSQAEQVIEEIASADLVTTAVGPAILEHIAKPIASGLIKRASSGEPLIVTACENAIGATETLCEHIRSHLAEDEWKQINAITDFPNSAVDRIVPNQENEDILTVNVEPFYEWVVDKSQIHSSLPDIEGVKLVDDLTPYIERKLFTVNTGHAMAAYLGHNKGYETIKEAIDDAQIEEEVLRALEETSALLVHQYGFDKESHIQYVKKIMERFRNPFLSDKVVRVARNPLTKLSYNERFIKPARLLLEKDIVEPRSLLKGISAALSFDVETDKESVELQRLLKTSEIDEALIEITGLDIDHPLTQRIKKNWSM
ncbi:mannitol-1-phosphate 5-dehydrogenase [Alkalihalobacillus trypoxylicola]|uniref:Mannitol-1-phosphate 5-dehydrogenase n=1 Tax=Alkalihalobacillus trypoxylicola TaxID=519424 RepID=A0A162F356_9BACI|nr:mannitol-1-phosphate 5-dehydrogenase [Alkalihalobacillus trypoxylicola]KYG34388.1 mannitol-1-phosphate 5-dehydrogenase [Alkalihalobacillus trypoxylicola]